MSEQKMSPEDCTLFAAAAAAYWADRLRGASPGLTRDAGHPDDLRSTYGDLFLASMPRPESDAIGRFEKVLAEKGAAWLARCGSMWLSVDYGPEGMLREAASATRVNGFPFKTSMRVEADGIHVKEGYGDEGRWLCQTKKCALRCAISEKHWADSPWTESRRATRTEAEVDAWNARSERISAHFANMPDWMPGDFEPRVGAIWFAVSATPMVAEGARP